MGKKYTGPNLKPEQAQQKNNKGALGGSLTMGRAQVGVEGAGWARSGVQQVTHAHGGRKLDAVLLHLAAEERRQGRSRGRRRG